MAKNINHLQHVKSSVVENGLPKLPAPNVLVEGELAVNYATDKETISLKNSSGIVVTFSSDNYYSEKKLGSGFTGENSAVTVTQAINDSERVVAAALTDLDERKLDASAYTPTDLSEYATKQWVDEERLGSGFTGENSGNTVTKVIEDNELAISAALNDLEERKLDESAFTESVGDFYTKAEVDDKLGAEFSGTNYTQSISEAIDEIETVTAAALNDLNNRKLDASATTEFATHDWVEGQGYLKEHQSLSGYATTAVTNQLRTDVNTLSGNSITGASYDSTNKKINFTTSTGKTIQIDASNFIKDGMVNDVAVSGVVSGGSTVKCLVVMFNTDAGKENINIPLSEMFDSSLYYTKTEIDNVLGSGFTVSSVTSSITDVIKENELIVASALNDLEDRKLDASAYTPTDLSAYATEEWVNGRLGSGFTDSSVTEVFNETEEVIAAALSDLDSRISGNTTYITQVDAKADLIARGLSGYTPSGYSYSKSETDLKLGTKLDASAYTPTDLSDYYTKDDVNDKLGEWFSGDTSGETFKSVTQVIREDERAIAAALTDLDERKLDASAFTESVGDFYTKSEINDFLGEWFTGNNAVSSVTEVIEDNELITAAALNDLNDKINTVSGSQLTASSFKTINGQTIVGSGNISIEGSGGGQDNVIEIVKVNGTALTPDSNKAVDITVPTSLSQLTSAHTHSEYATTGTVNTLSNTVTAHTANTTVHVTSGEKSTWNGKQDALQYYSETNAGDAKIETYSDIYESGSNTGHIELVSLDLMTSQPLSQLLLENTSSKLECNYPDSTRSSYVECSSTGTVLDFRADNTENKVVLDSVGFKYNNNTVATTNLIPTALSALTADATHRLVTDAEKTQWNNAISGVSFNGTTATVNNHVAAITATIPAAPGTLTTTATTAQATATNEALSGNIALHKVSKTGSYNDLNNKPTIPAAANNATITLQFGNSSSAFTVNASSNLTINLATLIGIPAPTASDNGKILGVVNGQFAWVTPTTIYTGTGTPSSSQGNNGDIYLQTS